MLCIHNSFWKVGPNVGNVLPVKQREIFKGQI